MSYRNIAFPPITLDEIKKLGWKINEIDIILISGDAYVDHPTFGISIIARILLDKGYKVAIISQPDWKINESFTIFGKPKLFFGITSGNMDSMINIYTADKKKRTNDYYSPAFEINKRPKYAVTVYSQKIREIYGKSVTIVIGGIEASLRRIAHYDYWSDSVKNSILVDSQADYLVYGMGEKAIIDISQMLKNNNFADIKSIKGIAYLEKNLPLSEEYELLPSVEEVKKDKIKYIEAFKKLYFSAINYKSKKLCQNHYNNYVVINPPSEPLTTEEINYIYELPYSRKAHPFYDKFGGIPALESVKFSIVTHRGCYGGCSFCALALHQGKKIQSRSFESILNEAKKLSESSDFKGTIVDLTGPSANMLWSDCKKKLMNNGCKNISCLFPKICNNLIDNQNLILKLYEEIIKLPKVKNLFIASGVRYDLALKNKNYLENLILKFTGGHLSIAPEHISKKVTNLMNKPDKKVFIEFINFFKEITKKNKKNIYFIPYFIASHPGCEMADMEYLRDFLIKNNIKVEQVQNFTPSPLTISTCMYYTEMNPFTLEKIFVVKNENERKKQKNIIIWHKKNKSLC